MKSIQLKELNIVNFKGIKALKLDFIPFHNNVINGANKAGKTSVFDAFTWLLFGKDSLGKSDFEMKPLDQDNNIIHNLAVEVSAELIIDGEPVEIRKVLSEKWVKIKGGEVAEFKGNETTYFYNSVPMTQREFMSKINNIIDEQVFKNITNPNAFVSLKWQEQRKVLVEVAGIPSDAQIAIGDTDLENLINEIGRNKTIEEFISQTKHSIKQAKEEINTIPARIEELNRSLPVPIIEKNVIANIASLEKEIENIDEQITNKMAGFDDVIERRNVNQTLIQAKQSKINTIEFETKELAREKSEYKDPRQTKLNSLIAEFRQLELQEEETKNLINTLESQINDLSGKRDHLREQWVKVNASEFKINSEDTCCSTCGQTLPDGESVIEDLKAKFNAAKVKNLEDIQTTGGSYKKQQEIKEDQLKGFKSELAIIIDKKDEVEKPIEVLDTEIKQSKKEVFNSNNFITESLLSNSEYAKLKAELETLKNITFETPTEDVTSELKTKKSELQSEILKLKGYLQDNKKIGETNTRIEVLRKEENTQNQVIALYERKLFLVEKFNKKKIEWLDESVNKMFQIVKFKLFENQINGGVKDTCEAMVNGVPFSNVNTASRVNAGIDIINTLCKYYKVSAPIFVDNKESVTDVIHTDSQSIFLVVSPEDKELRIN